MINLPAIFGLVSIKSAKHIFVVLGELSSNLIVMLTMFFFFNFSRILKSSVSCW